MNVSIAVVLLLALPAWHAPNLQPSRARNAHADGPLARGDASSSPWQRSYDAEVAGKFEQALAILGELAPQQRDGYLANFRRGWLLYRLYRYAESAAAYRTAASAEPASIEARVSLLLPLMALGAWKEVEANAQRVLAQDPENYVALQRLAFAKFSTQRYAESEVLYRRVLALYPSDLDTRAGLGWSLLRMGKAKAAMALFDAVLEISAAHASAKRGLSEAKAALKAGH